MPHSEGEVRMQQPSGAQPSAQPSGAQPSARPPAATRRSQELFARALRVLPGGVNSPVRAFKSVGGQPLFIERADGARIYDVDGLSYLDYVCSWGPAILGHNHPAIRQAVTDAAQNGLSFGAPTELEVRLADKITSFVPNLEMVRMVNSGTEAVISALRLARAYTGRQKLVKFAGCYHGHSDSMLVKAGSGALTSGVPDSLGVPAAVVADTCVATYNDLDSVAGLLQGREVAAVIVEPLAANMGVVLPNPGFLPGLRQLCDEYGTLLLFDEVICGFRLAKGGAQEYYGIQADLACYGKVIGGGLPVGAYGGRRQIMEMVAPAGPVYQAGTLSGNPIAMAAGLAQLQLLADGTVLAQIGQQASRLAAGLRQIVLDLGIKACVNQVGSLLSLFFGIEAAYDYDSVQQADTGLYARYFQEMLARGIYLAPSQFEAMFVSAAHSAADIDASLQAGSEVLQKMKGEGLL